MKPEEWCFASGAALAREAAFLPQRAIEEMSSLPPQEVALRLARSWFGPAEPLSQFDRLSRERRGMELEYFEKVSPAGTPVDLIRLSLAADQLRAGLQEIPDSADSEELLSGLRKLALRAGRFYEQFLLELSPTLPASEPSARLAASLLVDSAELAIAESLCAGESSLQDWSAARSRAMAGKVSLRAVRLGTPKDLLLKFFFRGRLLPEPARELAQDYREPMALRLYPEGCEPGQEERFLLSLAEQSKGQPYSAAVVLRYLLGFLEQESRIRRAVYAALGKIPAQEAA
jgi:hypothetical protein